MGRTIVNWQGGLEKATPQSHKQQSLPEEPLVTIEPSKSWVQLNLHELWSYRELLYFLAWRDVKIRYKQSVLGVTWVIMQPLLMTVIFTVFIGRLARVSSGDVPYPLFAYAGLAAWAFFSSAVTSSSISLVANSHLITKVYFPRLIVPASTIGARFVDFVVSLSFLFALVFYYRVSLTWHALMCVVVIVLMTLLSFGVGTLVAGLSVKYRDVGFILPVILQLWMFVSPVIYPSSLVPASMRVLYALNPLVGILDNFRAAFFNGDFNWPALGITALATLAVLFGSAYVFRRIETGFADYV